MTVALAASTLTSLLLAAALAAAAAHIRQLRAERAASGYRALVGCRVTASVRDGGSIRGVLTHVYEDAIVLAHPEYVAGARPAGIGADVTLARSSVPMLQRFDEPRTARADLTAAS